MANKRTQTSVTENGYKGKGVSEVAKTHQGKKRTFDDTHAAVVRALASYGVSKKSIAKEIGTDRETLKKVYGEELEVGDARAESQLKQAAWYVAVTLKNPKMIMYLLNTRYGYSESFKIDHTSSDGSMSPHATPEQIALKFAEMMDKINAEQSE